MNFVQPTSGENLSRSNTALHVQEVRNGSSPEKSLFFPDQNDLYNDLSGLEHLKLYQRMWRSEEALIDQTVNQLRMTDYIKRAGWNLFVGDASKTVFYDADRDRHRPIC